MSYYAQPLQSAAPLYNHYDPYAGTQSYLNTAPPVAGHSQYLPLSAPLHSAPTYAPAPAPFFDHHQPLTVDQQIAKFATVIAATSQLLSPDANPFIREFEIVEVEKETTKTKVPVYANQVIGGIPQTVLTHQEVSQSNPKLESYFIEVDEPRQLPNGQWVNVKTKVEKFRPKTKSTSSKRYTLKGVPPGANPLEFSADDGVLLSSEFVKAVKAISTESEIQKAENLAWSKKK